MAENVIGAATIKVTADTGDLQKGVKAAEDSLNQFKQTAQKTGQEVKKSMDDAASSMGTVTTSTDNLSKKDQRFVDVQKRKVVALTEGKSKLIEYDIQQKVTEKEQAAVTAALQEHIQKLRELEKAQKDLQDPGQKYLKQLQAESATIGMTRKEAMLYQASQLGVLEQAKPLIDAQFDTSRAFTSVEMSAKQTRQAMRLLPAQITDVVTSLASGMPMYLVAIQQGGQLRDSFGGFGNVMKGVASLISPFALAIGGMAAAGAAAYYAYEKATGIMREFEKTLIMTGNAAGLTSSQLSASAKGISEIYGSQTAAAEALRATVSSTDLLGQSYETISLAAVQWSDATGQSIGDVIKMFDSLAKDPAKAMSELDRSYNFLTASTYAQVQALIEQGRNTEASRILIEAMADTINDRTPKMIEQMSIFGHIMRGMKLLINDANDAITNMFSETLEQKFDGLVKNYFEVNKEIEKLEKLGGGGTVLLYLRRQREEIEKNLASTNSLLVAKQKEAQADADERKRKDNLQTVSAFLNETRTEEQKIIQKIIELNVQFAAAITAAGNDTEKVAAIQAGYGYVMAGLADQYTKASKDITSSIREQITEYENETKAMAMSSAEREMFIFLISMEKKGVYETTEEWKKYRKAKEDAISDRGVATGEKIIKQLQDERDQLGLTNAQRTVYTKRQEAINAGLKDGSPEFDRFIKNLEKEAELTEKKENEIKAREEAIKRSKQEQEQYERTIESIEKELSTLKMENETFLLNNEEKARAIFLRKIENLAIQDKNRLLAAYDEVAARKAANQEIRNAIVEAEKFNKFINDLTGRSNVDQFIEQMGMLGAALSKGMISPEQYELYLNQLVNKFEGATDEMGEFAKQAARNIQDALGRTLEEVLSGNFDNIGKNFQKMIANMLAQLASANLNKALFGQYDKSGNLGGIIGGLAKAATNLFNPAGAASDVGTVGYNDFFASGGYTGDGGKYEPAGVVHRGEYVLNAEATNRIGVGRLDRLNKGYSNGGLVTAPPPAAAGSVNINIKNEAGGDGYQATATARRNETGLDIDVIVKKVVSNDLRNNGGLSQQMAATFGLRRGG